MSVALMVLGFTLLFVAVALATLSGRWLALDMAWRWCLAAGIVCLLCATGLFVLRTINTHVTEHHPEVLCPR